MATINLFSVLLFFLRYKILITVSVLFSALAIGIVSSFITPSYSSEAKVMPPTQTPPGLISLVSQLSLANGGQLSVVKNPNDMYIGILRSRTIADQIINLLKLKKIYNIRLDEDARVFLSSITNISFGKDGLINISVETTDAKLSANIANQYVHELINLTRNIAITDATERRVFFEQQLKNAQDQLNSAEMQFKEMQEDSGLLSPENKMTVILAHLAQLKATLAAKELQRAALRSHLSADSAEIKRINYEIQGLRQQLAKLEHGESEESRLSIATRKIPQGRLEYMRRFRQVKYYETLFELISKQYELAKIAEASNYAIVQVLDSAVPAEKKTAPRRFRMVLFGGMLGGVLGIGIAWLLDQLRRFKTGQGTANWQRIKAAWRGINLPGQSGE